MQAIILVTFCIFLCSTTQGLNIEYANNLMDYDEPVFQMDSNVYPYEELKPVRRETNNQKKDLSEPINNDLSFISIPMISNVLGLFTNSIGFILSKIPIVLFSTIAAFGACVITPLCNTKILEMLPGVEEEMSSNTNSERLIRAAEFVQRVNRKFRSLNK